VQSGTYLDGDETISAIWAPEGAIGVPASPGTTWEAQAQLIPYNCQAFVVLTFIDTTGTAIAGGVMNGNTIEPGSASGNILASYSQSSVIAVAPANTVGVLMSISGVPATSPDSTNSSAIFFTQTLLGVTVPNASQPSPWTPGGVTSISGGVIKAATLDVNDAILGTLDADKITANSITAAQVSAGAIGANEIAAGSLEAYHLAADFALVSIAQFGLVTIDTAHIGNLQVTGQKIQDGSVSQAANFQAGPTDRGSLSLYSTESNVDWYTLSQLTVDAGSIDLSSPFVLLTFYQPDATTTLVHSTSPPPSGHIMRIVRVNDDGSTSIVYGALSVAPGYTNFYDLPYGNASTTYLYQVGWDVSYGGSAPVAQSYGYALMLGK
jgi:hypothetical protein